METTDNELREIAKRRVQARNGFLIHLTLYVTVNLGLVLIWAATGRGYPWFVWPLAGWGIGIVSHALGYAFGPGSPTEERAIDREVTRMRRKALPH